MSRGICDDLVVVQLGSGVACDLPGMLFADNGARVIKIEPPAGDPLRRTMPSGFLVWNRGKESVALDLKSAAGHARALQLIRHADVVIEAFGTGVASRLGLGPAAMRSTNPALLYCSIKGFGSTGPHASLKAYEGVVAAKAGGFGPNLGRGYREGPIFFAMARASIGAAHHAVQGIAAALVARETTGRGQHIEVTLFQGLQTYDYFGTPAFQLAQRDPKRYASRQMVAGVSGLLCSKDGRWLMPQNRLKKEYDALVRALDMEAVWDDPRYRMDIGPGEAPSTGDVARDTELWNRVARRFQERSLAEWSPRMAGEDDLAGEWVRTCEEALDHPQSVHNGHVIEIRDPRLGAVREIGPVALFSATPSPISRSAPDLDQHDSLASLDRRVMPRDTGRPAPRHPLAGITVVEFGHHYAMPYAITLIAALGARVIKIEPPEGDHQRDLLPIPEAGAHKTLDGKESVIVDARLPAGREVIYDLARRADVFALGLRQPAADRMRLDEAAIRRVNPDIVYFSATGYGDSGPCVGKAMHAGTAGVAVGAVHYQVPDWLDPTRSAGRSFEELADIAARFGTGANNGDAAAAASTASALALAILAKKRANIGQYVRTTMLIGNAYSYADDFCSYAGKPRHRGPDAEQMGFNALYRLYPAAEGWVFFAAPTQREWEAFCAAADPALGVESRFATEADRGRNDAALIDRLSVLFATRRATDWEASLAPRGIACVTASEATSAAFACTDPGLRENGLVVEIDHPIFGRFLRHGLPQAFSETPGHLGTGCWAGQHTDAVLAEFLGYSMEKITALKSGGACALRRERIAP